MKKLICILAALLTLLSLAACSKSTSTPTDSTAATTQDGVVFYSHDEDGTLVSEVVTTTKFSGTTDPTSEITVTVPASYINTLDLQYQNDLQLYCTKKNYISFTKNEETGEVTFKMTASVYNSTLAEQRRHILNTLLPLVESETYPWFHTYIPNTDYSEVTIKVDKKGYKKTDSSLLAEYIADLCIYSYQVLLTDSPRSCTVTVVDSQTGDEITQVTRSFI